MPPINDEISNATLINSSGITTSSVTNIGATGSAQEISQGYPENSVWYRIEITDDGDMYLAVSNSNYNYYVEIYQPADTTPNDFSDITDGFTYTSFVDWIGLGTGADDDVIVPVLAGEVYYLLVIDNNFIGEEGNFTLTALLPLVCEFNAEDGANLGSGTVSLSGASPQWVRDTQYRSIVDFEEYKGDWEYTESFSVTFTGCPSGKYAIDLYNQFGNIAIGDDGVTLRVFKNGKPQGGFFATGYNGRTDSSPGWERITNEYLNPPFTALDQTGGPRYFSLQEGDVLSFHYGSWDNVPARWMEVQKVRFTAVLGLLPLPQWRIGSDGQETWGYNDLFTIRMLKSQGDTIYLFDDVSITGAGSDVVLGVWTFQMTGSDIIPLSGDPGLASFGGAAVDIKKTSTAAITARDFTIMPNGDLYAAWIDRIGGFSGTYELVMKHYDASGDSWSLISNDVWGYGATSRRCTYVTMDNDGEDVFVAWGEGRQTSGTIGYWWRCKKYDVSGASFSELGSGQTAYPGATPTLTVDGEFDRHLRLKVSPGGTPWVVWPSYDPDVVGTVDEYCFAWYWDGSVWQDSGLPDPSLVPPDDGAHTYDAATGTKGNYVAFAIYGLYYADITFCHHDGLSEYPAICYQYVYNDVGSGTIDHSGWAYFEYDGSVWNNELYITEAVDIYADMPNQLIQARDGDAEIERAGGWTQGFSLDNDGTVPYLFTQKGWKFSSIDHAYCARVKRDGTSFEEVGQGFATTEATPQWGYGGWIDVTTNGGMLVAGRPVLAWTSPISWSQGVNLALFLPSGSVDLTRIKFRGFQRGDDL